MYCMAGNIGVELNLVNWQMKMRTAKLSSANAEFIPMVLRTRHEMQLFFSPPHSMKGNCKCVYGALSVFLPSFPKKAPFLAAYENED